MTAPVRPPSVAACLAALAFVDAFARLRGMRGALRLAARQPAAAQQGADDALVSETARRVTVAAAFYPRRALCLEQSLALHMLLRRRGVHAELRIGVHARPFFAHAWVEVEGAPVAEQGDIPRNLTMFPSFGV